MIAKDCSSHGIIKIRLDEVDDVNFYGRIAKDQSVGHDPPAAPADLHRPRLSRHLSLHRHCRQESPQSPISQTYFQCSGSETLKSGSVRQSYGSGSFYHQGKRVRKTLNSTDLWLFHDFVSPVTCLSTVTVGRNHHSRLHEARLYFFTNGADWIANSFSEHREKQTSQSKTIEKMLKNYYTSERLQGLPGLTYPNCSIPIPALTLTSLWIVNLALTGIGA